MVNNRFRVVDKGGRFSFFLNLGLGFFFIML